MAQGGEDIIPEDERRVAFLSNDDINPISPTKDALLDPKRRHIRAHMPGSKGHEGHFSPALEVMNDGHSTRRGRATDYTEHTKVIFKPCPREAVLYSLYRLWHRS